MTKLQKPRPAIRILALTMTVVCGCVRGEAPDGGQAAPGSNEAAAEPVAREPLTEADLAGLSLADLSVEIPWTRNRVSRDPGAKAAPSGVLEIEASTHEAFDRVLFRFTDSAPFPGYRIEIVGADTPLTCGEEEGTMDLGTERTLVVRLGPAQPGSDRVGAPGRMRSTGGARLAQAATLCTLDGEVVWGTGLTSGEEVRLLELRGPQRLAVDVR